MTNPKSVFEYLSARRYLVDAIERRKKADRAFSIRKWAREMGMPSHTLLVMMLQGKRALTLKQAPLLSKGLGLSTPERLYFQCLIQYESARTDEERDLCRLWMSEISPGANAAIREVDEFLLISHWVHMAILALSETRAGCVSAEQVAARLGARVSVSEARSAIERLSSLGLLRMESVPGSASKRYVCTAARVTTKDDVANRGAREYFKQTALLASEAVERLPLDRREFQGFAIAIPEGKRALAKEMIRKFRTQFSQAMKGEPGDEVFQMNIQLFQLTESPSEMVPTVDEGAGTTDSAAKAAGPGTETFPVRGST